MHSTNFTESFFTWSQYALYCVLCVKRSVVEYSRKRLYTTHLYDCKFICNIYY